MNFINNLLNLGRKIIPRPIFRAFQPAYHWVLAFLGAVIYGFPSRRLKVVGVTGTSGKTTTVEFLQTIFRAAGFKTASLSGLYFRILDKTEPNMLKMTMPGRFLIQKFLGKAKNAGSEYVFLEVTSEGIKQYRHKFIKFYAAILTNLSPEHIESHKGFENYRKAKSELFKIAPIHILNGDDDNFDFFYKVPVHPPKFCFAKLGRARQKIVYKMSEYPADLNLKLKGEFNKYNVLAAFAFARLEAVDDAVSKKAIEKIESLPGRMEFIETGENFKVLVDYAFLPQTLQKVYQTLEVLSSRLICVLGAAGGGRDKWKRPELAKVAEKYCREIILTNEDPYDENPLSILEEIESGFSSNSKSQITNSKQIPNHK